MLILQIGKILIYRRMDMSCEKMMINEIKKIENKIDKAKIVDALMKDGKIKPCDKAAIEIIAEMTSHRYVADIDKLSSSYKGFTELFEKYVKVVPKNDMYSRHGILPILEILKQNERS